ncbi:MAG: hypothetical protein CVV21_06725 [Candidatus Goldiibacteriota bacterium HGW-Goldbacteria-1]|nr:MAG: hypothetical protein CVV21_06725 [Candidatus Goldiibacteriota bacterium HGW-Goldbacteria-1]
MKKTIIILSLFLLILIRKTIPDTSISSSNSIGIMFRNSSSVYVRDAMDEMLRLRNWIETDIVENALFTKVFIDEDASKGQILMIIEPVTFYKVEKGGNVGAYIAASYISPLFYTMLRNSRFTVNVKLYNRKTKTKIAETTVTSEDKSGQGISADMIYSVDMVAEKVKEFLLECNGAENLLIN